MRAEYLECGKIINTHGIDGTLKLESWCDAPGILAGLKTLYLKSNAGFSALKVKKTSVFKSFVLAKIEGITDFDAAAALKGRTVYAKREDMTPAVAEGAHFIADLIGLPVIDAVNGRIYGKIKDVINSGASDIYVVRTADGESMVPAVSEFIERIDLDTGVYIKPIEGMF
jgi:16S rRNA processing protein RimM